MQRVIIHYFSGTGNTAHAVKLVRASLEKKGYQVNSQVIKKGAVPSNEKFDFHILAFSTLGFSAPVMVKRYIRKLKNGGNGKVSVLAVFGGHPMQALMQAERMLRRRNYDVFLTYGITYPNNWIQVMNLPDSNESREIIAEGDKNIENYVNRFTEQKREFFKCGPFGAAWSWVSAELFGLFGRRFFGKLFIAGENCNNCGICVKSCPANAITIKGLIHKKPYWNFSCENCSRCINICPKKAIQLSIPRLILHLVINVFTIVYIINGISYINRLLPEKFSLLITLPIDIFALIIITTFLFWAQFYIIDGIFFFLEQIPGLNKFFELSYTKKFRRYVAPDYKLNNQMEL